MRRVLITNDDGIDSSGLLRLAQAAQAYGEVWIIAPDGQRSAASHSITLHGHIDLIPHPYPLPGVRAYSCSGTPADCVRVACRGALPSKPDLVLCGINYGYNAGTDLQYSATAGAAFEGAFQGVHSIALSERADADHAVTDAYLDEALRYAIGLETGPRDIVNVNFPGGPLEDCRGIVTSRRVSLGSFFDDDYDRILDLPGGGFRLKVAGKPMREGEEDTDIRAILDGCVSIGFVKNISTP